MENAVLFHLFYLIRTGLKRTVGLFSRTLSKPLSFPCTGIQQLLSCDLFVHANIDRDCLVGSALSACAQRSLLTFLLSTYGKESVADCKQKSQGDTKAHLPASVNDNRPNEAHPQQKVKDECQGPPALPSRSAVGTCSGEGEQRDPDLEAVAKGHHGALGWVHGSVSPPRR